MMRIPSNYCPHCERFKKWYQVSDWTSGYCNHCGTKCKNVEVMLKDYVQTKLGRETKGGVNEND